MNQIKEHPTGEELTAFNHGQLSEEDVAAIAMHLERCGDCCAALSSIPDDGFTKLTRSAASLRDETLGSSSTGDGEIPEHLALLERYQVEQRIGIGGMGEVYRAQHKLMQRTVALKVINPSLVGNPEAISRFRNEVRTAASLSHPNIVSSFDAENVGDLHFLVMELVNGSSLAQVIQQNGPLDFVEAVDVIEQAARGLDAAYEKDMVHRDIKPQNLMLDRAGVVKILDFGLARIQRQTSANDLAQSSDADVDGAQSLIDTSAGITGTNLAIGTPDYLAPEQARDAAKADTRSDIYSLGCTLRFLLTGQAPFPKGNSLEKISQHMLGQPTDIRSLRADIPQDVADLIDRMMAKDPTERFQTPSELLLATAKVKQAISASGSPLPRKEKPASRRWFIAASLLAIGCAAFATLAGLPWVTNPPRQTKVLLIAPTRAYYPDYESVKRELDRRGVEMTVAAAQQTIEPVGEASFEPFEADLLLDGVQVEQFDAIVFVGGEGTESMTSGAVGRAVDRIIGAAREIGVPLGGVCVGVDMLRNCGVDEVREMLADATEERLMTFDGMVTVVDTEDTEAFMGRLLSQVSPRDR